MAKKPKFTQGDDNFNLGGGDDSANAKGGNDVVSGGSGNDKINGGAGNDFLRGGTGDDRLNGGAGDDRLAGGEGDDTLLGGKGSNTVDGGAGDDLVILDGKFADAKISEDGDGGWVITTAGGTTKVKNVESFQFEDGIKGEDELIVLPPGTGKTFILTDKVDGPGAAAPAIDTTGTAGDDTYIADGSTLTSDVINGGDGKDVLRVSSATGNPFQPTMTGVESIEVTNTAATTFNFANVKDVTSFKAANGNGNITLNGAVALHSLTLDTVGTATTPTAVKLAYAAAAVAGATDSQAISVTNSTLSSLDVAGAETLAITSAGTKNTLGTVTDAAVKAITITGAAQTSLVVDTTSTSLASFDASAATGKISATFNAVSDVVSKGGSLDDTFIFGSTFTSKDTVDGGAGTADNVSLAGGDFSLATNDTLKGLNALTNVEVLTITGTTNTSIDRATLTNATIASFVFNNTAGNTTVANAKSTDTYSFGPLHDVGGTETFGTATSLKLALAGDQFVSGVSASDDADAGSVVATAATTIALSSVGVAKNSGGTAQLSGIGIADTSLNDLNVNTITGIQAAANAAITITGDAHTSIGGLTNAATVDASALTGDFQIVGSAGADTIKGSKGVNEIQGGAGTDTIDLAASAANVDTVDFQDFTAVAGSSANRDIISGFKAGAGGDMLAFLNTRTTAGTATSTPAIQEFTSVVTGAATVVDTSTKDIAEFNFNNVTTSLGDGSANSLNGTNLLALVTSGTGTLATAANNDDFIIVAYQAGNAYVYLVDEGIGADGDNVVAATDIQLVAEVKGVAVGGLDVGNFDFV